MRVDPLTHPDRSPGVKERAARVAGALLAQTPGARIRVASVQRP
ncbi:MAG: hypothetical protein ACE5IL_17010 [Myxococcota bacterium]